MITHTPGIVIQTIAYGEKGKIVKVFTEALGMQSYFVRGLHSGKSGIKSALFQPLSIVDMVVSHKENSNLHQIKEIQADHVYLHLYTDPVKRALLVFSNELLVYALREETPNAVLFRWLYHTLVWLDLTDRNVSDFHLILMIELTRFLGFYPKRADDAACTIFDMQEGIFVQRLPIHPYYLTGNSVKLMVNLLDAGFEDTRAQRFTTIERRELVEILITYYKLHLEGFKGLKSLDILKQVLS